MNEPIVKTCDIQVHLGVDAPSYQTISMKVPVSLMEYGKEGELRKEISMHVKLLDEQDDLQGSWDSEWESSNQLRVISVTRKQRADEIPARQVVQGFPIEPNYWEIAQGVIGLVRNRQEPTRKELTDLLETWGFKL